MKTNITISRGLYKHLLFKQNKLKMRAIFEFGRGLKPQTTVVDQLDKRIYGLRKR